MLTQEMKTLSEKANEASQLLKALSHQHRLMILCFLVEGEKSVGEIENFLGCTQSSASQHLGKLRDLGILSTSKIANQVFYRISDKKVHNVMDTLKSIYC